MDLVQEALEALVFGQPCADLGEQSLGDVDGAGLALLLEGEVLSGVPGPAVVAAAGGATAAVGVRAEGGGEAGRGGGESFETRLEDAEDEARRVWDVDVAGWEWAKRAERRKV